MADPPTHFFKFVPPGFLFNLSIPSCLLTNLENGNRCSKVILRRGRHKWSVDIDDGVFGDGWRRFVRENGVQESDFIVFSHQGNMVFDIMVFDQSTCEKHYPNLYDEVEGEEPPEPTESDMICTQRPKKLKKRKRNDYASEDEEKLQVGDSGCFTSKMTPSIINRSRLYVPMKFARSNGLISWGKRTKVYLMDDTQRLWPATLRNLKNEFFLMDWREFGVKNHLKVGDVFRFELVRQGEVPIFKCYNTGKKGKNLVKDFNNHPYFISSLKPTSFKRSVLHLPVGFSIPNDLKIGEMIVRDDKGRSWKVHLNKQNQKYFYLGQGFRDFLVANGMKVGDTFKFELVEKEKDKPPIVNIFFINSKPTKSHKERKFTRRERPVLCKEDCHPYFVGELKSYSIRRSTLYLPNEFAKSNGLINNKKMTLKNVEDERSWTVEFTNYKNRLYYLGRGWKEFRVANGLNEGDQFKLELVHNREKPTLNFYFRNIR